MQSIYQGFTIAVTSDLKFRVEFNPDAEDHDDRDTREFKSAEEAKSEIEAYIKTQSRMKLKTRQTKLAAFALNGEPVTISGVHAGNGTITFKPKINDRYSDDLYPTVGFALDAIKELRAAKKHVEELEAALRLVEITLEDKECIFDEHKYYNHYNYKKRGVEKNTEILLRNYDACVKLSESLDTVEAAVKAAQKVDSTMSQDYCFRENGPVEKANGTLLIQVNYGLVTVRVFDVGRGGWSWYTVPSGQLPKIIEALNEIQHPVPKVEMGDI